MRIIASIAGHACGFIRIFAFRFGVYLGLRPPDSKSAAQRKTERDALGRAGEYSNLIFNLAHRRARYPLAADICQNQDFQDWTDLQDSVSPNSRFSP